MMLWLWRNVLQYLLPVGLARWAADALAALWARTGERWSTEPSDAPPESTFLPSWVRIDPEAPFAGAFPKPEMAGAMALLVCACRSRGDTWLPMTQDEFQIAIVGATQLERILGAKVRMPPDVQALAPFLNQHRAAQGGITALVNGGYTWLDGDTMRVAPRGLRALARFAERPNGGGAR